jgi:dTDP-4-amino-4,6-dideoxygalactose transaminase
MKGSIMQDKPAIIGGKPVFTKPVPFASPTLPPFEEVENDLRKIFETGMVTKGPYLDEYEKMLSKHLGVPYVIGVSSATTGLHMLLKALNLKGEVIVPSFSFMASFHVLEHNDLTPVFVDCEMDTFTIDPAEVERAITSETSAIMGVNIFGNPPEMDQLEDISKRHNIRFIMDSAHSFGTLYKGKPMGRFGDGEVFSTSATKLIATGEGGVVTTKHKDVSDFIRLYREYGNSGDYDCAIPGINGRLSEFHALVGLRSIPRLHGLALQRNRIAEIYINKLKDIPGIVFQKIRDNCRSSYKDFSILIDREEFGLSRDLAADALVAEGIHTRKYFYPPGHMQKYYRTKYGEKIKKLPNTEYIAENILTLPIYSHMTDEQAEQIADTIVKLYNYRDMILNQSASV